MPYEKNADLPEGIKNLPEGLQEIYRKAFNAALEQYDDNEETAAKVAWAAVKKKYKKEGDEWVALAERKDISEADKKRAVEEYGNVTYADETNKKYPIDTEEHIRAALNYINKKVNAAKYSSEDLKKIKSRIIVAWKKVIDKEGPPSEQDKKLSEDLSFDKIIHAVDLALRTQIVNDGKFNPNLPDLPENNIWVVEVFDDFAIYTWNEKLYRANYIIDDEGKVTISNIIQVEEKKSYKKVEDKKMNEILHTIPIYFEEPTEEVGWNDLIMDGEYTSMQGNSVIIDNERLVTLKKNFEDGVRGQDIPVTLDHPVHGGIAAGWLKALRLINRDVKGKAKKVLQGLIDWTPTGTEKVKGKEYKYISSELLPKDILKAVSLVNFPAVKGMKPVELSEDKEGYKHIFLMGGDTCMENQETFISTLAETIVERLQAFFMDKEKKEMKGGKKEKRHLPERKEGEQWCIFQDDKQLICGPDEEWADAKLEGKEEKITKASEEQGGGEDTNMDEKLKTLVENTVIEKTQALAEENKALKVQLDKSTERLTEVMEARRLDKLEVRISEALKISKDSQFIPEVGTALREAALAEPKDYEEKVFALMSLLAKPTSIIRLDELGTSFDTGADFVPDEDTAEFFTEADKRAREIMKEENCDYKVAANKAFAELRAKV